tara:strand:+ start:5150 stop:5737 length:588 start_codon:yes stop_codon:yes gene_type:complete
MNSARITPLRIFFALSGIIYVWSLPLLSQYGFTQKGSTSISGFIANPPATGAMAAISFMPLTLMWEFQDGVLEKDVKSNVRKKILTFTLSTFQFFYGCFLVCTETYVPLILHQSSVTLFGISFIFHSFMIINSVKINICAKTLLTIGIIAFGCLLFAEGMWFWAFECIGFSSMLLYTPILWYTYEQPSVPLCIKK